MVLVAVGRRELDKIHILAVKARRDIARFLGTFDLAMEGGDHLALDGLAALGVDRVGDVGVEFQAPVAVAVHRVIAVAILVALKAAFVQVASAVVAETGAEVVFLAAAGAMVRQLAAGHGQKKSVISFDQFDVANDERVVEGQGAERLEAVVLILGLAQLDPDVGQAHRNTP